MAKSLGVRSLESDGPGFKSHGSTYEICDLGHLVHPASFRLPERWPVTAPTSRTVAIAGGRDL